MGIFHHISQHSHDHIEGVLNKAHYIWADHKIHDKIWYIGNVHKTIRMALCKVYTTPHMTSCIYYERICFYKILNMGNKHYIAGSGIYDHRSNIVDSHESRENGSDDQSTLHTYRCIDVHNLNVLNMAQGKEILAGNKAIPQYVHMDKFYEHQADIYAYRIPHTNSYTHAHRVEASDRLLDI